MERIKAADLIAEVDHSKNNDYDSEDKLRWIQDVEDRIIQEIINTHDNPDNLEAQKVTEEYFLIASGAYADVYRYYLKAQIDKDNEEYDRYNNNMTLYNGAYEMFKLMWHNTHIPVSKGNFKV